MANRTVPKRKTVFKLQWYGSRFGTKNRYGTVSGDPFKRYAPEEKLRYVTVRYGQGDKFGRTTVSLKFMK